MNLDKYARDAPAWASWAKINFQASMVLFERGGPHHLFPAATLGHHALEMHLKAALINAGMTIFNPQNVRQIDPAIGLAEADCAWGHVVGDLAMLLATKRPDFDLSFQLDGPTLVQERPIRLLKAIEHFDPFFSELRYPREKNKIDAVGSDDGWLLAMVVEHLEPFSNKVP
jgi:hypothetical protein